VKRLLALIALLALVLAACGGGGGEQQGGAQGGGENAATGEPVKVGAIFDLSGATADVGTPYSEGMLAYVEWRNNNGGVGGRPIDLLNQDYGYDVATAEQFYSQYQTEGVVAFQGWGTGDTEALRSRVTEDEIPFMSASYAATLTNPEETPYNFVVALSYSDQMRVALRHIADTAQGHAEVAVFHHDSPFGTSPVEDGRTYIADNSLDIGYETYPMPAGATDYTGELSRAQQQGATHIVIQNVSSPAATLAQNVRDSGVDVQIVCLNWCGDELFVELAGEAAEGAMGVLPFAPPATAEAEAAADLTSYLEEQGQSLEELNLHFTQGWYTMHVMAEAIADVVESGQEVTGPAIKTALEEMEPIQTPVTTDIDFTAESHEGMQSGSVYQVTGGVWSPVSDVITP
jgi:branched-chain amino acid transport system substrate-binding protein